MTAQTTRQKEKDGSERHVIQLAPSFWTLVVTVLAAVATITATIYSRPDRLEVQAMIDATGREIRSEIRPELRYINEKVEYTRQKLDQIDSKLDQIVTNQAR